jgi:sugar porter (SP) family MFS transporter
MSKQQRVFWSASIAAFGGFVFGYDASAISGAVVYLTERFKLSPAGVGWAVASALVGCMIGAALVGEAGDRFGRKRTLVFTAICYVISGAGSALAWNFTSFWIFRVLCGMAIGLTSMVPLYISEIAPRRSRGRLTTLYQIAITLGLLLVCIVNWRISQYGGTNVNWHLRYSWRWMLGSTTVPAILFAGLLAFLPESPRWLLLCGRTKDARRVLEQIADTSEIDEILRQHAGDVHSNNGNREISGASKRIFPTFVIACTLGILQQAVGINAIVYHGIKLLSGLNLGGGIAGAFFDQVLIGAMIFLSTFISIALVDRWGRRPLLIAGSLGVSVTILTIGIALWRNFEGPWLLSMVLLYIVCFGATLGPVVWVMIAELAPDFARARVVAVAALCNWLANATVSQTFPMINDSVINHAIFNGALPFLIYGACGLIFLVFAMTCVPETKGQALGEIGYISAQEPNLSLSRDTIL